MLSCPCTLARAGLQGKLEERAALTNTELLPLLQKESSPSAYASWYPPVQQMLLCLSKLYRCVESRVFAGLAQDAVSSCTKAVQVSSQSCRSSYVSDCGRHLLACTTLSEGGRSPRARAQAYTGMHECISMI